MPGIPLAEPEPTVRPDGRALPEEWQVSALLSGFIATICLTIVVTGAYLIAEGLGSQSGALFGRWMYGLSHNTVTDRAQASLFVALGLNVVIGVIFALIYARYFEPRMRGPGYLRGMLFSIGPAILALFIVMPILGIGVAGMLAGSGPLAAIGIIFAHLVYGFVLGEVYGLKVDEWEGSSEADLAAARGSRHGSAIGVLIGMPVGLIIGLLIAPQLSSGSGEVVLVIGHVLLGGALGLLVGSLLGMQARLDQAHGESSVAHR